MKKEIEMLNYIYLNAEMGIIGIDDVLKEVENEKFSNLLETEKEEYESICAEASKMLIDLGEVHEENSGISKIRSNLVSKMGMIKDKSLSTIAKMMMEGTNKGIIEIQEKINNFKSDKEEILDLAEKLLKTEENNIEELKKYL